MAHTQHCVEMAIMAIVENNETTRVLEPDVEEDRMTSEDAATALEWLANGNVGCHEPELCGAE